MSRGALCPVEEAVLDNAGEKLKPMKETEFEVEEETGTPVSVTGADPNFPTLGEVDTHNLTHHSCRSWCPHCVTKKGETVDHRRAATKDNSSKKIMVSLVPVKGVQIPSEKREMLLHVKLG